MTTTTGKIDFQYQGVTYQTWYKVVGNLQGTKAGVRPLIALHGGPGMSHSYMTPHADFFASHAIPVVLYDQIGGGESSHYKDAPKEFWTVELFMDELENLLNHFGISGDYDLVGHSWGGMLAATFAAARQPAGLKHLVVADSPASIALWEQSIAGLVEQLPQDIQDVIKKHEAAGMTKTPEYREAMLVFYKKHLCRLETWPDALSASFAAMEADPTVHHTMHGPSEFTVTGNLKTWNIIDILPSIKVSTLIINSVYDGAQDACVLPFFDRIPKVKWVQFASSSHFPFFEEPNRYKKVVGDFLTTG